MVDNTTLIPAVSWIVSKYMYKRQVIENYVRKLYFKFVDQRTKMAIFLRCSFVKASVY